MKRTNAVLDIPLMNDYFVYHGREGESIPLDVTRVRFHPSVRAIEAAAFYYSTRLVTVILNDELEEIGEYAFNHCGSLNGILIPNSVRTIGMGAFYDCDGLTTITLGERLEEIGAMSFARCGSLQHIDIPNSVKILKWEAFDSCRDLMTVDLGNGLEEIESRAFNECTSLQRIVIPPAVTTIDDTAFEGCSNLTCVKFCDEVEEFVSCEAMREWWNQGLHEKSLCTYCFLVRFSIPERILGLAMVSGWQLDIYNMLKIIPTVSSGGINAYFYTINSKLLGYEQYLKDAPMLLELAIWKTKITDQSSQTTSDARLQSRSDSLSMVHIIVRSALSFL
jgi:hypothetical protein